MYGETAALAAACRSLRTMTLATSADAAVTDAPAASRSIAEESYVRIGGIERWLTIKGEDRDHAVVLFLHGGPGDPISPFADALYSGWERDSTLVQWDQRGAGRTFARNGPSLAPTLTVERMVQDGLEVAQYLTAHLHRRKILLVGGRAAPHPRSAPPRGARAEVARGPLRNGARPSEPRSVDAGGRCSSDGATIG